jgi:signal transduction histidine kinase
MTTKKYIPTVSSQSQLRNRMLFQAVLFLLGVFLLVMSAKVVDTISYKKSLAHVLSASVERDLEVGDFRNAVINLERSSKSLFTRIEYIPSSQGKNTKAGTEPQFILGDSGAGRWRLIMIRVPTSQSSEIVFFVNPLDGILVWIAFALPISLLLSLLFFNRSWKRLLIESEVQVAAQVAHDIRSPLAALDTLLSRTSLLPEDERTVIRSATNRIRDIANSLLRAEVQKSDSDMLCTIVERIISEKRAELGEQDRVKIESDFGADAYGLFVTVDTTELERVLSNLINNALEAIADTGSVTVSIRKTESPESLRKMVEVEISDTGRGISPSTLKRIGRRGETAGKAHGNGLGLFHARQFSELQGGRLVIDSTLGCGTRVCIELPQGAKPKWFVEALKLTPEHAVVIVDDDPTIHELWRRRFLELGVATLHAGSPTALRTLLAKHPSLRSQGVILIDHEFAGERESGLNLILSEKLREGAFLVTSHSSEFHLREECANFGIGLIPKSLAGFIPIAAPHSGERQSDPVVSRVPALTSSSFLPQAVLLDDDPLIHLVWKSSAEAQGIRLQAHRTEQSLFESLSNLSPETPIYLDAQLWDEHGESCTDGVEVAQKLYGVGFRNLHLATGSPPERYQGLTFINSVRGKEPPWKTA